MSYLLDTTVLIDWASARPGIREIIDRLFAETSLLYTTDIVVCEALSGGTDDERSVIGRLVDGLEYVVLGPDGAREAGDLRRAARRSSPRTLADAVIAALARSLDATVVTRNPADYRAFDVAVIGY